MTRKGSPSVSNEKVPPIFLSHDSKELNPLWLTYMESKDSLCAHHLSFFLSGPTIDPNVLCSALPCSRRSRSAVFHDLMSGQTVYEPMLLCFTCNEVSHVKCNGLTIETFKEQHVPWRCKNCQVNIHNDKAKKYKKETGYQQSLKTRRKLFLRPEHQADPLRINDDEEIEFELVDTEAFNEEHDSWTAYKSAVDVHILENENKSLHEQIEKLQAQLSASQKSQASTLNPNQYSEVFRKNSTAIGGEPSTSFDFSRHFNQSFQQTSRSPTENASAHEIPQKSNESNVNYSHSSTSPADVSDILNKFTVTQQQLLEEQLLSTRRKMMPKISEFDGEATKWIEFSQDVERYQKILKYDDETIKLHLRGALKGQAFDAIKGVFNLLSLQQLMDILKNDFGDPLLVVSKSERTLKEFKIKGEFYREDALKLRQLIQSYFSACIYAKMDYLNSNYLGDLLYRQFRQDVRIKIREFFVNKHPSQVVLIDLSVIHDFLLAYTPLLDPKSYHRTDEKKDKANQLNYTVMNNTQQSANDKGNADWKFQIISKEKAPYLGYDMNKVNELKRICLICNKSSHFTVKCHQYSAMTEAQRLNIITEKSICQNCVLTNSHKAKNCEQKLSCGFIVQGRNRCTAKHHPSIHRIMSASYAQSNMNNKTNNYQKPKNGNKNRNTEKAKNLVENAQREAGVGSVSTDEQQNDNEKQQSVSTNFTAQDQRSYNLRDPKLSLVIQVNAISSQSFQKTVKMIKHDFIGPNGIATAFSVGDSAAEITLVRDDLRRALGIEGTPETLSITWTDKSTKLCNAVKFDLKVQGIHPKAKIILLKNCYAIKDLNLPSRSLDMRHMKAMFPHLRGFKFDGYKDEQPVMLIGTTHATVIENIGMIRAGKLDEPIGIETALGFSVFGGNPELMNDLQMVESTALSSKECNEDENVEELFEAQHKITNEDLHILLKRFNAIESLGIRATGYYLIEEERKAIEILQEEMRTLEDGTIEVPLIWNRDRNKNIPKLANNYAVAFKRQVALEKKLAKTPEYWQGYKNNVKELLNYNYMRLATSEDLETNWPNVWYLPMGLVINANKNPPKLRNIYDARSRYANQSLNDLLLKGPDLLINLVTPILCIRLNPIAFSADVKHMFHRIEICLRDQQCQRVLFREDTNEPMEIYILNRMAFGPKCSPFVSQYIKNWNADHWMEKYPKAAEAAKNRVYMDDVLLAETTVDEAIKIAKQLIEIFKYINWELVSFQSNSKEFLRALPNKYVKSDLIPLLEDESTEHITKILGCSWSTTDDAFIFQLDKNIFVKLMTEFEHQPTKKDMASLIARIFDIMGFIAHYTIRGKILLQRTWKLKIAWDEQIPPELHFEWKEWLNDIKQITKLKIPRMIGDLGAIHLANKLELHAFSDAGVEAFGAVVYLVVHSKKGVTSRLLMAKAKVTPLRFHTETEVKEIPRLELMAALISARLAKTIMEAYDHLPLTKFFWSDSEIVLRWILNPNHRLLKYAVGPIEEILEISQRSEWKYVPTLINPADICTKFKKVDFSDAESLWFTGPEFIKKSQDEWPKLPERLILKEQTLVYNVFLQQLNYSTHILPPYECDEIIDRFSPSIKADWNKLRRAVARALKIFIDGFIPAIKSKLFYDKIMREELKELNNNFRILSPSDYERAEHFIFRKIQREQFAEEYEALKNNKRFKNKEFQRLNVFLDPQGLLRINSRTNLNDVSFPQQYAPILPRKDETTYLLLRYYHCKFDHIAIESQIAEVRTRCWIPKLRQALKVTKSRCNTCKVREAQSYEPCMAPLPEYRINPTQRPFEVVGVDCFGPYLINLERDDGDDDYEEDESFGENYQKIWIVIFTCTLTRYVHLHILDSLESIKVLEAIVIFNTSYGPILKLISDNGLNFVGAANVLQEDAGRERDFLKKQQKVLASTLAEKMAVEWEFIPPYSPWMGGVYERLIKEIKRALYEILNKSKLHRTELNIAIHEVSHRLNCRPLTYNSTLADDGEILTPHHLAKNKSGWPLLPGLHKGKHGAIDDKDIYRKGRALADTMMAKFTANYLPEYARRSKWFTDKRPIKVNDLVLIVEPTNTRRAFARGRVIRLHPGRDGKSRKAEIEMADKKKKLVAVRNLARLDLSL